MVVFSLSTAKTGASSRVLDEHELANVGPSHAALDDRKLPYVNDDPEARPRSPFRLHDPQRVTPLPKAQLFTLCSVRLIDPIAFTQIFPYVNEMMDRLHLTNDPSKIGFYSGLVESSFAVSQLCCIYHWARVSDRIGRRPVVLAGILGIGVSTILLGLAHSLGGVLLARSVAGIFSGNIAVIHSVLGEITDATNQAVAFPIYGLFWPLGAIIGLNLFSAHRPLLGGTFSRPAERFPSFFDYEFLRAYPYFLPCFVAGCLSLAGAALVYLFLEETLPSKRNNGEYVPMRQVGSEHGTVDPEKPAEPAGVRALLSIPLVKALCLSGFALSFLNTGFDVTFVLFSYSAIERGGLNFETHQIGYALAMSGAASVLLQLFFMPYLLRRFDHARMYNACMALWPFCYVLMPGLNLIARAGTADGVVMNAGAKAMVWVGIAGLLGLARTACLAYSVSMILVKEAAPDPSSLGATNGLCQFFMCFARSFSPAFVSSLFAFSNGFDFVLLHYLWVLVMVIISFLGTTLSRRIAEGRRVRPALARA
ncbi:MFS general substrate transporter [Laetiporus sulphureus 93-53]|uniref:MFS general substrate transporter n=1 Tax=Laetiporus sulphureus 93-53 TaxID=1314785 RepID=A0A165H8Z2_9APHY|nr:MFS general substrate transporter [Laetiporus sulphureus 93-53]KZT11407.1 MFS general substrate transporter [Laetiporus sulphureus 93-53]